MDYFTRITLEIKSPEDVRTVSTQVDKWDCNISQFRDLIRALALAAGYAEETVNDSIGEWVGD